MKKILTVAIFLLTLLPMMNDASFISAQNLTYENGSYWLPDIGVNGTQKVKCDACGEAFDDDEKFNSHLKHSYACQIFYGTDNNKDDDDPEERNLCPFCNQPYGSCSCQDVIITGNGKRNPSNLWDTGIIIYPSNGSTEGEGEVCNTSATPAPNPKSTHNCSCMVTPTRKDAVKNVSASTISTKNKKTGFSASNIATSLKKAIEFPETINQGNYGTCGAAAMEKELATYHPYLFRECIESLISNGHYSKWGLTLPDACGIKSMTDSEVAKKGLSATDVIFQTAFATWASENRFFDSMINKLKGKDDIFRPRTAGGDEGGVSEANIKEFMHKKLGLSKSEAELVPGDNFSRLSNIDCSSYTYIVSVHSKYNKNTKKFEFPNEKADHLAEITGIDKDGVHIWTWGQELIVKNVYASKVIRRTKTKAVKEDENKRKGLACECSSCTDSGCSQCK